MTPDDALELCRRMRMNLTQLQGQLTDVMETLATVPQPADRQTKCPTCGVQTRGPLSLAEHIHTSHDGPLPPHWARAETAAELEA